MRHLLPLLARDYAIKECPRVTAQATKELTEAGIPVVAVETKQDPEVPALVIGEYRDWRFVRRWYYWSATSDKPIPYADAIAFHAKWGKEARVGGDCTCSPPVEDPERYPWRTCYHIDTQEALRAYWKLLVAVGVVIESPYTLEK